MIGTPKKIPLTLGNPHKGFVTNIGGCLYLVSSGRDLSFQPVVWDLGRMGFMVFTGFAGCKGYRVYRVLMVIGSLGSIGFPGFMGFIGFRFYGLYC